MLDDLRTFLLEKSDAGVKAVRVKTVLDMVEAAISNGRSPKKRGSRIQSRDLLGAYEVAALLGVDRTRPSKWMFKGTKFGPDRVPFPKPIVELKSGPIWLRSDVEKMIPFVEERRRTRASDD